MRAGLLSLALILPVTILTLACILSTAGGQVQEGALIVTQIPAAAQPAWPGDRLDPDRRYPDGSRIVVVADPERPDQVRVLSQGLPRAGAPSLSFDGRRVVFTGSRSRQTGWTLFEAGMDGRRPVQILKLEKDCIDPAYLAHGRLIFTCAERGNSPRTWSLHTASATGQEVARITFGPGSAFDPTPLADGRILFAMQQEAGAGRPRPATALFTINADGTMLAPYTGSHDEDPWKVRPRATADGGVIFISAGSASPGHLERVEMSRPMATRRQIHDRAVLAAEALPGGGLLIAAAPESDDPESGGLFRLSSPDEAGSAPAGMMTPLMSDPDHHLVEALMVAVTPAPPERPSAVNHETDTATLVCYDAGRTDGRHGRASGQPFKLVAEMLARPGADPGQVIALGPVPMAADGSFHIEVPADRPLRMVSQDSAGRQTRSEWFWLRPGEVRACFGCHESRETAPPNRVVQALATPAESLPVKIQVATDGTQHAETSDAMRRAQAGEDMPHAGDTGDTP